MPSSLAATAVSLVASPAAEVDADILFLPVREGEGPAVLLDGIDDASAHAIERAIASKEFQGKPYELFVLPTVGGWKAARVALIGAGRAEDVGLERVRRVASAAALEARKRRFARVAVLNTLLDSPSDSAQAIAEGLVLASYSGDVYKSGDRSGPPAEQTIIVDARASGASLDQAVERGRILAESCNIARDLCNEP